MKKLKVILMCILTVLVTGCDKNKDAISPEDFSKILVDSKYSLIDKSDTIEYATAAYLVNTRAFDFAYVQGKRKYDIEGLFVEECKSVMNIVGSKEHTKDSESGPNYAYLKVVTEDKFFYVSWIGDTYIYIKNAPIERQKELEAIIKKLGY